MIYQRKPPGGNWTAAWYERIPDGEGPDGKPRHKLRRVAISTGTADREQALAVERHHRQAIREVVERNKAEAFIRSTAEAITGKTLPKFGLPLDAVWPLVKSDPNQQARTERTMSSKLGVWEAFRTWLRSSHPDVACINDVTPAMAKEYTRSFSGMKGATIANHRHNLSSIWQIAMVDARMDTNPWDAKFLGEVRQDYESYRDLTLDEVRSLFRLSAGTWWSYAIAIAYSTGLRLKDVVHLRREHFQGGSDPDDLFIVLVPAKTKRNRKELDVYVTHELRQILAPVMEQCDDYLFPAAVALYRKSSPTLSKEFTDLLDRAKIKASGRGRVGFHSLRVSFITNATRGKVKREVIQGAVGHGSPQMTARYNRDREAGRIFETALPKLLEEPKQ
jgi:integrase